MKAKQTFSVITQSALSSDEWKVLTILYQPLMGVLAFSLYQSFYHLLNAKNYQSEVFTHQFLADLLFDKLDKLDAALEKLEALNLIDTYQNNEHYIYQLKAPLTPRGFLKDTVLGQFLKTELGPKMYTQITGLFRVEKMDLSEYKQITKNFDDVFNFVAAETYRDSDTYLGKRTNGGAKISSQLNYETFAEKIPDRYKKNPMLLAWKTQDTVQKLVFVYQLSMDEMVDLYVKTVQPNGEIDLGQLSFKAQAYYQTKKKELPIVQETKQLNENDNLVKYLKTASPIRIIENYATNDYQLMAQETVMQLLERNQVEVGLINALLLHILKFKEGELPHISYLEKVLETWLKKGIKTTEDAYEAILSKESETPTKNVSSKPKKKSPEWVLDYLKELRDKEEN